MKRIILFMTLLLIFCSIHSNNSAFAEKNENVEFDFYESDNEITLYNYKGDNIDGELIIPERINNKPVTKISFTLLRENYFTNILIPNSIKQLGVGIISDAHSLKTLTIPESVTKIEGNPLSSGCILEKFIVSKDNKYFATIDGVLFNKIEKKLIAYPPGKTDTEYTVPEGILVIGQDAFMDCDNLTKVYLPKSLNTLENEAFTLCNNLKTISFYGNLETIKGNPFETCRDVTSIDILENNGRYTLMDKMLLDEETKTLIVCYSKRENIQEVPNGTKIIAARAFDARSLKGIILPDTVEKIGAYAFSKCDKLETIKIPDGITVIEPGTFSACSSLTSIEIPDTVKEIGYSAFYSCRMLKEIEIPFGVEEIDNGAFSYCPELEKIIIPASVEVFGNNIFQNSNNVTLYVEKDSFAEDYAKDNELPYKIYTPQESESASEEEEPYEDTSWLFD